MRKQLSAARLVALADRIAVRQKEQAARESKVNKTMDGADVSAYRTVEVSRTRDEVAVAAAAAAAASSSSAASAASAATASATSGASAAAAAAVSAPPPSQNVARWLNSDTSRTPAEKQATDTPKDARLPVFTFNGCAPRHAAYMCLGRKIAWESCLPGTCTTPVSDAPGKCVSPSCKHRYGPWCIGFEMSKLLTLFVVIVVDICWLQW